MFLIDGRRKDYATRAARAQQNADKVARIMADLPADADDIAQILELQGARGCRGSTVDCPLAVYFMRQGGLKRIEVGLDSVGELDWDVTMTRGAKLFVKRFDRGCYPALAQR